MKFLKQALIGITLLICLPYTTCAQENKELAAIKETILEFFDGLHKGDTAKINEVISPDIIMESTFINDEGKRDKRIETRENFLKSIASKNPEDIWLEKLLNFEIHFDGPLASVWTPYEFYRNSILSHCGANSFQLFKKENKWKIIYLIDSRKRSGCSTVGIE